MKNWLITYTLDKVRSEIAVVKARTYTMALVQFLIEHPNAEYTAIFEVIDNESAFA